MNQDADSIRVFLRAVADSGATRFYPLWQRLQERAEARVRPIESRIGRADSGRDAAYVVLSVSALRSDGEDICWSISVRASPDQLQISCAVEISEDQGYREVFGRKEAATSAAEAAALIARLSEEVCAQDGYLDPPSQTVA